MKQFFILLLLVLGTFVQAQDDSAATPTAAPTLKGEPVIFKTDTLFYVYSNLGPYTPEERATAITSRLQSVVKTPPFEVDSFYINETENGLDIRYKNRIITTVTHVDAKQENQDKTILAAEHLSQIQTALKLETRVKRNWKAIILRWFLLFLSLAALYGIYKLIGFGYQKVVDFIKERVHFKLNIKNYELVSEARCKDILTLLAKGTRIFLIILTLYLALPIIFSIFPYTQGFAAQLFGYILKPIKSITEGIISFVPNAFTILVIYFSFKYLVRLIKFFTDEIAQEKLVVPGFYPDWAKTTYQLLRFVIYAFMLVMIFPYLPGSGSPVFQGVSVFIGLLISLGSSSAISNAVAGLVITYMRPFKIGDRVKIGDVTGDVLGKTILVTRLKTTKNEEITIPNSSILSGHTVNYTTKAKDEGLVVHTTITIGYDVPWRDVHEMLIGAAKKTDFVDQSKPPFVLQTSLDDFYVSYQINAFTHQPEKMPKIYSSLHANIQDAFNEAGVEILSPHYRAPRDGNQVTIPAQYLPADYVAPTFRHTVYKSPEK